MKVKQGETPEQRQETMRELYTDGRIFRIIAIVALVIGVILAVIFFGSNKYNSVITVNKGNPYTCQDCKEKGRACAEHKDFDKEQALKDEVYYICERYSLGDDEITLLYDTYGYGNEYNKDCDFCNEQETECYSCKYTREAIISEIDKITSDKSYINELCSDCQELGYAHCTKCRDMLKYKVSEALVNE